MTYYIKPNPIKADDKHIYCADGGACGYIKNGELHLISRKTYYLYNFANGRWYMRNDTAGTNHYLGEGASPALNLENIVVEDDKYWSEITYLPKAEILEG